MTKVAKITLVMLFEKSLIKTDKKKCKVKRMIGQNNKVKVIW
jgi:hypothetical protein